MRPPPILGPHKRANLTAGNNGRRNDPKLPRPTRK
jgi:hypothetical protein